LSVNLYMIITRRWRPTYPSVDNFLRSVVTTDDPLFIRRVLFLFRPNYSLGLMFSHRHVHYLSHAAALANKLSDWKEERLPPPRVNQSTVGHSSFPGTTTESERNSMTRSAYPVSGSYEVLFNRLSEFL